MTKLTPNLIYFLILFVLVFPSSVKAQESVTISISPTLYDVPVEPGQSFSTSIKIVNVNNFDLTLYAEVMEFLPKGEGGDGRFLPLDENSDTLANWMSITSEPIIIPKEQSIQLPIDVKVPDSAPPGGHFAAIMISTKPSRPIDGQARLQTAQTITSLFFARVAGNIIEDATIREFTTNKTFLSTPEVTFSLRFENKGNVHLKPQGDIKIYNMWGEERGVIPINQYSNFGNVLSNSIRKFNFTWKGEWSVADIGRYTAIATLGYGVDNRQFSDSKTFFWVIPYKLLLGILISLATFFVLVTWLVRLYIRHTLIMSGINIDSYQEARGRAINSKLVKTKLPLHAPVQAGILDLTKKLQESISIKARLVTVMKFVYQYRLFFFALLLIIAFIFIVTWYITSANTKHRAFEVEYENSEVSTSINSEEILYRQMLTSVTEDLVVDENLPPVMIVNRSGIPGIGAKVKVKLEKFGYNVTSLSADFSATQKRTVIVYPKTKYEEALILSDLMQNALASAKTESEVDDHITIFTGSDQDFE